MRIQRHGLPDKELCAGADGHDPPGGGQRRIQNGQAAGRRPKAETALTGKERF